MSNDKNNEYAGEFLSPDVARKQIIEIGNINRVPPSVGIFDAPIRCFKINQEWWSIVAGMVHWLADVAAWQDAQDESYPPIQAILEFMRGVECETGGEPMLRQKPDDSCVLQQSLDNGETWSDVFDFSLCFSAQLAPTNIQLTNIERQNIINSGYSPTQTTVTGSNGAYTDTEIADMSIEADVCDTSGKDAVYGAVDRLVRYIHGKNVDFLQQVSQGANIAQQIDRAISATPIIGLLPADEIAGYIGFIVDELFQEYNATVDEDLLQNVICDLFCIAVNSGCHLDFNDVINYFAGQVQPNFSNVSTTFLNLVQFATTGTFSGDDYFYFMCYFQLQIAFTKQRFLDIQSIDAYAMQAQAGFNSPDNDWTIFCLDCPQHYRLWTWDFANGLGDFTILLSGSTPQGALDGNRLKGVDVGSSKNIALEMPFPSGWRVHSGKLYIERVAGIANGTYDTQYIRIRPTPLTNAGSAIVLAQSFGANGVLEPCNTISASPFYVSGGVVLGVGVTVSDNANSQIYLSKIELLFMPEAGFYKPGAVITTDSDLCS